MYPIPLCFHSGKSSIFGYRQFWRYVVLNTYPSPVWTPCRVSLSCYRNSSIPQGATPAFHGCGDSFKLPDWALVAKRQVWTALLGISYQLALIATVFNFQGTPIPYNDARYCANPLKLGLYNRRTPAGAFVGAVENRRILRDGPSEPLLEFPLGRYRLDVPRMFQGRSRRF